MYDTLCRCYYEMFLYYRLFIKGSSIKGSSIIGYLLEGFSVKGYLL